MEVISFMNNKNSKVKKIVIAAMAVICAFSSATAITAGAKTTQYKHTVSIGGYSGANDTTWISVPKKEMSVYDLFSSYPTIYNKKSSTYIQSRAELEHSKRKTDFVKVKLQKNYPAPKTADYGKLTAGNWLLNYKYISGGGCRSEVTTCKKG